MRRDSELQNRFTSNLENGAYLIGSWMITRQYSSAMLRMKFSCAPRRLGPSLFRWLLQVVKYRLLYSNYTYSPPAARRCACPGASAGLLARHWGALQPKSPFLSRSPLVGANSQVLYSLFVRTTRWQSLFRKLIESSMNLCKYFHAAASHSELLLNQYPTDSREGRLKRNIASNNKVAYILQRHESALLLFSSPVELCS
jgi:hypothetical protein